PETKRLYPEGNAFAHILGFVGSNEDGEKIGRYGIEGTWNTELSGEKGLLRSEGYFGRWVGASDRTFIPAVDGAHITLTIDRGIQYMACEKLRDAVARFNAEGGTVIIMDPKTGAVLAMCNMPDYDPNEFASVSNIRVFNNDAVFTPYEPGSIFKPFTLAA